MKIRSDVVTSSVLALVTLTGISGAAIAQQRAAAVTILQPGIPPVARSLSRGQNHRYTVELKAEEVAQIVVEQKGIDVLVRVTSAEGKALAEFDNSKGMGTPENVSVVSPTGGTYTVIVQPLAQTPDVAPGQYEIQLVDVHHANKQQLKDGRRVEDLKIRGMAIINELEMMLPRFKSPQLRIRARIQIAQYLRPVDEKLARRWILDATSEMRKVFEKVPETNDEYNRYNDLVNARSEVVQILGQLDPELALEVIRSTRPPEGWNFYPGQPDQELYLEASLATQLVSRTPERAAALAEDILTRGYVSSLIGVVSSLRNASPALSARVAAGIAARMQNEDLLNTPEAANLAMSLLSSVRTVPPRNAGANAGSPQVESLLPDEVFRSLLLKCLSVSLAFSPEPGNNYSPATDAALNILSNLKSMAADLESVAPGRMPAVEEKYLQLQAAQNPDQRYHEDVNNNKSIDDALRNISLAPQTQRENLYQQIAQRIAREGDFPRARVIIAANIQNLRTRQNALRSVESEAISSALSKGQLDEVIRILGDRKFPKEQMYMVGSMASRLGSMRDQKKDAILGFLEQIRMRLGDSEIAGSREQMNALLQIAGAFARHGSTRGFEIVEPLIKQLNDLSVAATALSGFGQQVYEDGELMMYGGNVIGDAGNQMSQALGLLALTDFDRARRDVDRIKRPEIRIRALLQMAQQAFNPLVIRRSN